MQHLLWIITAQDRSANSQRQQGLLLSLSGTRVEKKKEEGGERGSWILMHSFDHYGGIAWHTVYTDRRWSCEVRNSVLEGTFMKSQKFLYWNQLASLAIRIPETASTEICNLISHVFGIESNSRLLWSCEPCTQCPYSLITLIKGFSIRNNCLIF